MVAAVVVHESSERLVSLSPSDLVAVHVEPREQRAVQERTHSFPRPLVEASGVVQERQCCRDDVRPCGCPLVGSLQRGCDPAYFIPDGIELGPQLVFGPLLFGSKIKVVVLFAVEDRQMLAVLGSNVLRQRRVACERFLYR
ncbi:hypothetical protein [Streptomyces sp. NPDC050548]|uniref:hypothetical protein n=1 Tax=Streptomyces sp. NPDC050548 TaxID=3365629 RepID=UPI0037AE392E